MFSQHIAVLGLITAFLSLVPSFISKEVTKAVALEQLFRIFKPTFIVLLLSAFFLLIYTIFKQNVFNVINNIIFYVALIYFVFNTRNAIMAVYLSERELRSREKECPNCGETVKGIAKVCHYCGYKF
ncbi:MAG: zinc ribbon domain-containing protein [Candidatus Zambryskibacteria bacterium]|nr:zinc ribbon domain-containing protein [Candidatus Zambryskibacteria bacterium]